ncbi:MAG: AAA family ATPase [Synergistaceae bacterium]|nr:AAA family ATPase [Synergistaceae bacterium]MBR0233307.1 AAA family ATPase [Synergistaceae bacterium]
MKVLPIGIQNFKKLREANCLYVDKTGILQALIENGFQYFLSRPRRFGKSLTLSTLEAMFKGEVELFKGLKAEEWVKKQASNPTAVLRFDMSRTVTNDANNLDNSIKELISRLSRKHKVNLYSESTEGMLADLLEGIFEKNGLFVLLIDEYDKPILDNITNLQKADEMREVLRSFYTTIKSYDEHFRFVFITGISKFSKTGVFSAMNNLVDISMLKRYGDIAGYTQNELEENFNEWIMSSSKIMAISKDELLEKVKAYYDGFSFDGNIRLYNPFSILNFFFDEKFGNYWYISGSPSFIAKYMKKHKIQNPDEYRHIEVPSDFADSHEIETSKPESFLYQSGYLTIEKFENDVITLDYPNEEVRKSLTRMYLDEFYHINGFITLGTQIWQFLTTGDIEQVITVYNIAIADIPYEDFSKRDEFWYRSLFVMLLRGAGFIPLAEVHTYKGRADVVVQFERQIVVLEFKFAETSSDIDKKKMEGLEQIKEKGYAESYDSEGRKVISAAVVADDENRKVMAFETA